MILSIYYQFPFIILKDHKYTLIRVFAPWGCQPIKHRISCRFDELLKLGKGRSRS